METFVYKQGWNDQRKLLLKLSEVMEQARYIQKRGENKFHKYNYVTEADVNEKIGSMLAERKIVFIPNLIESDMRETTTKSGSTEYIVKVKMEFTFMDAETGEAITTKMEGEGQDNGDKAIYKAISGTQKYVLLKFFTLGSGDDPEGDEGVDERNNTAPSKYGNNPEEVGKNRIAEEQAKAGGTPSAKVSVNQSKMLAAKHKASTLVGMERVNNMLGYNITKFEEVKAADCNKLIKFLDENKSPV